MTRTLMRARALTTLGAFIDRFDRQHGERPTDSTPVRGQDGNTYGNAFEAGCFGVTVASAGACACATALTATETRG